MIRAPDTSTPLSHLDRFEAEAIETIREVAAEFERPGVLYLVGKDSSVLLPLLQKALAPAPSLRSRCCTSTPSGSLAR